MVTNTGAQERAARDILSLVDIPTFDHKYERYRGLVTAVIQDALAQAVQAERTLWLNWLQEQGYDESDLESLMLALRDRPAEPAGEKVEHTCWFAQDAGGGRWREGESTCPACQERRPTR